MKMLLYPFEEQFDVPALSVEFCDRQSFVSQMVGKEAIDFTCSKVFIGDHSESFGIALGGLTPVSLIISSLIIPASGSLPLDSTTSYSMLSFALVTKKAPFLWIWLKSLKKST